MKILAPALAASIAFFAACDSNPDERTLITGPRIMTIRATPPALGGFDGSVSLRALALDATGDVLGADRISFRVCSPWAFLIDPERDCPAASALIPSTGEITTQELLEFYPPPSGAMGGVTDTDDEEPVAACKRSATIEVPVLAEAVIDGESLLTVKRIPIYLDDTPRKNPELEEVEVIAAENGAYTLSVSVDPSSLDRECRNGVEGPEAIRVFVYSTGGSFDDSFVDIVPDGDGNVPSAEISWTSDGAPAVLVMVAIDNDGGVDWQTLIL